MRTQVTLFKPLLFWGLLLLSLKGWSQPADNPAFVQSVQLFQAKKYDESLQKLSSLVRAQPDQPLYWFNWGNCAYMLGRYDRALKAYQKVISLKGKLSPAAHLYSAKALKALGRDDEARAELQKLLQSSPPAGIESAASLDLQKLNDLENKEDEALNFYQMGEYQSAEEELKSFPEEDLSVDGRLLLGMSFLKQKKYVEAERSFGRLRRLPGLSSEKRALVLDLLKRARRSESDLRPYWLSLDFSYGSTDNAYLDGKSVSPVASPLTRLQVGFGYHFHQNQKWSEKLGYLLSQEEPEKARELKTLNQTLQGLLIYRDSSWDAAVGPYFQTQTWGQVLAGQKLGAFLKVTYTQDPFDYGVEIDSSRQESKNSDYNYLQGSSYSVKPTLGWWDRNFYAQVSWIFGSDGTEDITYADGSRLPLTQNYLGPGLKLVWKPSDDFATFLWLYSLEKKYVNVSLPEKKDRKDQEVGASLKFAYYVLPNFSFYQLSEWTSNASTLGASDVRDKNYQVLVLTAGLAWDVF